MMSTRPRGWYCTWALEPTEVMVAEIAVGFIQLLRLLMTWRISSSTGMISAPSTSALLFFMSCAKAAYNSSRWVSMALRSRLMRAIRSAAVDSRRRSATASCAWNASRMTEAGVSTG